MHVEWPDWRKSVQSLASEPTPAETLRLIRELKAGQQALWDELCLTRERETALMARIEALEQERAS